jgi:hypothetical protein
MIAESFYIQCSDVSINLSLEFCCKVKWRMHLVCSSLYGQRSVKLSQLQLRDSVYCHCCNGEHSKALCVSGVGVCSWVTDSSRQYRSWVGLLLLQFFQVQCRPLLAKVWPFVVAAQLLKRKAQIFSGHCRLKFISALRHTFSVVKWLVK